MTLLLGLVAAFLADRILVYWYLPLRKKPRLSQPYYWDFRLYHATVWVIVTLLLVMSMFSFAFVDIWLAFIPPVGLLVSIQLWRSARAKKLRDVIRDAVAIEQQLLKEKLSRLDINRRIADHFVANGHSISESLAESDLSSFLKCCVLPDLGLYKVDDDFAAMSKGRKMLPGQLIDNQINSYRNAFIA